MEIIIRDDDINFFTKERSLKSVYASCFEKNIPICLGVTPLQSIDAGNIRTDIPLYVGRDKTYNIQNNKALCTFLRKCSLLGNEICLHGISHARDEDLFSDQKRKERFAQGLKVLKKSCGKDAITYIPPFNRISGEGLSFLEKKRMNVSSGFFWHYRNLPLPAKTLLLRNIIPRGQNAIFLSDEHLFGLRLAKYKNPVECLAYAKKRFNFFRRLGRPLIIINHHWDFDEDEAMIWSWNSFVDWALRQKTEFRTFSGSYPRS